MFSWLLDIVSSDGPKADYEVTFWDHVSNLIENSPGQFFLGLLSTIGSLLILFIPAIILFMISKNQRKKEEQEINENSKSDK